MAQKWPAGTQRNYVVAQKLPADTQKPNMSSDLHAGERERTPSQLNAKFINAEEELPEMKKRNTKCKYTCVVVLEVYILWF